MRFNEYMDYWEVLQEILHIGSHIFPALQQSSNVTVQLSPHQISLPIHYSGDAMGKIELLSLLSSGSKAKATTWSHGIYYRDVPLPPELENALLFWPSMTSRDFRHLNLRQITSMAPELVTTSKTTSSSKLDSAYTLVRQVLTDPSYTKPSQEHQLCTSRLFMQIFETQEFKCVQLAGLGHLVLYCLHRSHWNPVQDLSEQRLPNDAIALESTSSTSTELFNSKLFNWLVQPQGELCSGVRLTGFQSELVYILRNAVTTPIYIADEHLLKHLNMSQKVLSLAKAIDSIASYESKQKCAIEESNLRLDTLHQELLKEPKDSQIIDCEECGNIDLCIDLISPPPLESPCQDSRGLYEDQETRRCGVGGHDLLDVRSPPEELKRHSLARFKSHRLNSAYEHHRLTALSGKVLFGSNIDAFGWTEYVQILRQVLLAPSPAQLIKTCFDFFI